MSFRGGSEKRRSVFLAGPGSEFFGIFSFFILFWFGFCSHLFYFFFFFFFFFFLSKMSGLFCYKMKSSPTRWGPHQKNQKEKEVLEIIIKKGGGGT